MADRLLPFSQREVPGLVFCEGCCPSALPKVGAAPPQPRDAGAPPCTRVTFPSRGKSPKARQGLCPLESPGAWSPPFSRSLRYAPSRAGLPSTTNLDRFATLSWWVNRSFFSPSYTGGHTPCCQSVARWVGYLRGCLRVLFTSTNTARAQGRGIKGGRS